LTCVVVTLSGCSTVKPTDPYHGSCSYSGRILTKDATVLEKVSSDTGKGQTQSSTGVDNCFDYKNFLTDKHMTLDDVITIALKNNPELSAIEYEISVAQSIKAIASGQNKPVVDVYGGYLHYLNSQRIVQPSLNGKPGVFGDEILSADIGMSLPLYTGGRISSQIQAAELIKQSTEHELARAKKELVFNISKVFYGVLAQRKVVESFVFSQKTLEEHLKRVLALIKVYKGTKEDRLRTEVRIADVEQRLVQEENLLYIQLRLLTSMMGLNCPGKPVQPSGELIFNEKAIPEIRSAMKHAFQNRSDFQAACITLESLGKKLDVARSEWAGDVALTGFYGGRWAANSTDKPDGYSSFEDSGRIGIVFNVPIFDGGQIDGHIKEEQSKLSTAQERLRRMELRVQLDVETSILNIQAAVRRIAATNKVVEQGIESLKIQKEKYSLGRGAIIDVLDAQSALLDGQTNYYRALEAYSVAMAQHKLAIGTGLE